MAVGFCGVVLACGGPEERKAMYRTRAQDYVQQGNYPKARVALRNALKIDPNDTESWFLFAQVEEREQNWRNAYGDYLRVVELQPDHEAALIKLGKIYLESRAYDKTREIADKLLAQHPGHAQGQALQIAVEAVNDAGDAALHHAESLYGAHPTAADAAMLLATLYASHNRHEDSERVLKQALVAQPRDVEVLNALASAYLRSGKLHLAEQTFRQILNSDPATLEYRLRLAGFYDQQKDYDKAETVLREAIQAEPQHIQRHLTLADFLATRRGPAQGERVLLDAVETHPRATELHFALGRLDERSGQNEKARSLYQQLVEEFASKPAGQEAEVRIANLDWEGGKEDTATQHLVAVLHDNPRASDALVLQGKIALRHGRGKEAVQAFRTVLRDQPDLADAHALLGQSYLILGETNLAHHSLNHAIRLNPRQFEAHVALANLDIAAGRKKEARTRLEHVLTLDPNNVGILGLLLTMQTSDKDWSGSAETLARLRANGAGELLLNLAEGYLHQSRQEHDQALAAFERAARSAPDSPEPLMALVRLDIALGRPAQAQQRLTALLAVKPSHSYAHGLLGELLLLSHDESAAERHFQEATKANPEWITPWVNWAGLKFSKGRADEAQQILISGLTSNPSGEILRVILATSFSETGRIEQAIAEYQAILAHNARSVVAANNLAALLAEYKADASSLEQALALSREFERTAPNPMFLDTLGWVHHKMGHAEEAVRVMKEAVTKAPEHPVVNYHAGAVYYRAGQLKEAKVYLERALRTGQGFPGEREARTLLASVAR